MDFALYVLAGAGVGFAVGLTGIGGGSLMTPLLLLFGFPAHIAVGTDLLYAAITKSGGVFLHHRQGTIRWSVALTMMAGSIPASLITVVVLANFFDFESERYGHVLTTALGVMLILTAVVLLYRNRLRTPSEAAIRRRALLLQHSGTLTLVTGVGLGIMVTLSSVGAGAIGTAALLMLYPRLPSVKIVGTDLVHAVPLTLVAGMGHLYLGNVDLVLLAALLVGSLPAIVAGTWVGNRLPNRFLQPILASALLALGVKYAFF